jgi:predicted Zn-dependent protease with MMP-like domain
MDRRQFERLVNEAIAEMPEDFRRRMENVVVMVEDEPTEELLERMEIDTDDTLFGLYEGVPLTERGADTPLHPDCIWIFQGPIEDVCGTEEEIREEIQLTIMHEIAHFFGIDDDTLEDMGY